METSDLGRFAITQGGMKIIDMLIERARLRLDYFPKCSLNLYIGLLHGALFSTALRANADELVSFERIVPQRNLHSNTTRTS